MNDTRIDKALEKKDDGYLLPGITLDMKLAAIKAYNRTSGKCSPVSLVDAVAAAIAARPPEAYNIDIATVLWDWFIKQGVLESYRQYDATEVKDEISAYYAHKSLSQPTAFDDKLSSRVFAWMGMVGLLDIQKSYHLDEIMKILEDWHAAPALRAPDRDVSRQFKRGDDRLEHDADHMRYDIDEPAAHWSGRITVRCDEELRDFILAAVNGDQYPATPSPVATMLGRDPIESAYADDGDPRGSQAVNHPPHYGGEDNQYEVIKVLEAWLTYDEFVGAMKFNIHKYLARALKKNDPHEDYDKAAWYSTHLAAYIKRHAR